MVSLAYSDSVASPLRPLSLFTTACSAPLVQNSSGHASMRKTIGVSRPGMFAALIASAVAAQLGERAGQRRRVEPGVGEVALVDVHRRARLRWPTAGQSVSPMLYAAVKIGWMSS